MDQEQKGWTQEQKRKASAVLFLLAIAGWLWFAGKMDIFVGTGWDLYFTGFVLGAIVFVLPFVLFHFARWKVAVCALAVLLYFGMMLTPWHPRKQFIAKLNSIQVGMTIDEVDQIMDGYMLGFGRGLDRVVPAYPTGEERKVAKGNMTYRWSKSASYNADWGRVFFEEGRVVKTEFLPD
ncbi:MAG: hypothetical protein IH944_08660 [Armatimonadetes bacterium]|nr:hypothetical protein [Armatimonadota bacterium]